MHRPYEPAQIRPLLCRAPKRTPSTGASYVGLVAFVMRCYGECLELNVRTSCVDERGQRSVVFLAMEATGCRGCWPRGRGLPITWSQMSLVRDVHFWSTGAGGAGWAQPG
ncbi:DUF2071 domain-containing protein [Pseudonocardia bannensis]|uniref:Uncharacterized protein n=1 Tax=Pseudonocardia bannensis TaxID=630973 RepID=A0A848DRG6_9PSEU|nr:hypothetical protein [Pseudonocardia bannensis]